MSEVNDTVITPEQDVTAKLQAEFFGDSTPTPSPDPAATPAPAAAEPAADVVAEIEVPKEWLKKEFDIEDPAILKAEREEYRKLKETPPVADLKFENEQSKQIFELLKEGKSKEVKQFLDTQERLEQYTTAEVTKNNTTNIIKMDMQLKYPSLTKNQIEFQYKQEYSLPKEPAQKADELDEEFEERKNEWKEKVASIEMKTTIAATMAKPELENAKSKLVLPEIQGSGNQQAQPTQEELAAGAKLKETFLKNADTIVNAFKGFEAQVKDKDVDYTVNYTPSKEEKQAVGDRLKQFAESGFNANVILADRWVKEDGTLNESQMTEDLSRIFMGKNADQKIASEAANQRLELYLKGKKNVTIDGSATATIPQTKTKEEALQEAYWGN